MPLESEPNADVYRGAALTERAIFKRLSEFGGRDMHFDEKKDVDMRYVSMSQFDHYAQMISRNTLLRTIETTMIGNRFLYTLDSATGVIVARTDTTRKGLEGVAVVRVDSRALVEQKRMVIEPCVSVEAFGVKDSPHNGFVMKEISGQLVTTAHRVAQTLQMITGRMNEHYQPCVVMNAHNQLRPTLPAERVTDACREFLTVLQNVTAAEPRMGTGFGDALDAVLQAQKTLLREFPDNAFVRSVAGIEEFAVLERTLRMGGDERIYANAQRMIAATLALITSIHAAMRENFEQMHPDNCGRPFETTVTDMTSDGAFTASLEDAEYPLGTVKFLPQDLQDKQPRTQIVCFGDDVFADLAGAAISTATKGEWWKAQLRP